MLLSTLVLRRFRMMMASDLVNDSSTSRAAVNLALEMHPHVMNVRGKHQGQQEAKPAPSPGGGWLNLKWLTGLIHADRTTL